MDKVSVIIPTYNRASFIKAAVESALRQSYNNIEILVIDDGSSDNTKNILTPYIESKKIKYFFQKNKGVSSARNKGITEAKGVFLAFLDSDDEWTPDHISILIERIRACNGANIAFSNFKFAGDDAEVKQLTRQFNLSVMKMLKSGFCKFDNKVWVSNTNFLNSIFTLGFPFRIQGGMINKEFLEEKKLRFDETIDYTEEAQFILEAAVFSKVIFVDEVSLIVNRHQGNVGDECYREQMIYSYENRIKKMKFIFKNKLNRHEKKGLYYALWEMQEKVMLSKGDNGYFKRLVAGANLIIKVPTFRSLKSVLKFLLP